MSLVGLTCKPHCPDGQFKNRDTGRCEACHPTCKTCTEAGPSECTTCVEGLLLTKDNSVNRCQSVCLPGQFRGSTGCTDCHSSCKTCNGGEAHDCLSCPENQLYFQKSCVNHCPQGTYADKSQDRHCQKCHPVCESCSGPSDNSCTHCQSPLYLQNSSCVMHCSQNFATHKDSRTCTPCGQECKATPNGHRDRSVHEPSSQTLDFVLTDPKDSGLIPVVIIGVLIALLLFFVVFGVLQMRSVGMLCWGRRYTILTANFDRDHENEDEAHLMSDERDEQEYA